MSINRFRSRAPQPKRASPVVFSVGRRVFVHGTHDEGGSVTLTDEQGNLTSARLCDGAEVEVLAWRPRGSAGTRYRVRGTDGGFDGWLGADELRASAVGPSETPDAPTPDRVGWGFGSGGGAGR